MKKYFYIFCSVIFWSLLFFLLHIIVEVGAISLLLKDFGKYSLGLTWEQLILAHYIFTIVLLIGGITAGIFFGFRWWRFIYIDKKYRGILLKIKN